MGYKTQNLESHLFLYHLNNWIELGIKLNCHLLINHAIGLYGVRLLKFL